MHRTRYSELKERRDILLLDNVRFMAEEMTLFEIKLNLTLEQMARHAGSQQTLVRLQTYTFATLLRQHTVPSLRW